jgi:hypothetical protein
VREVDIWHRLPRNLHEAVGWFAKRCYMTCALAGAGSGIDPRTRLHCQCGRVRSFCWLGLLCRRVRFDFTLSSRAANGSSRILFRELRVRREDVLRAFPENAGATEDQAISPHEVSERALSQGEGGRPAPNTQAHRVPAAGLVMTPRFGGKPIDDDLLGSGRAEDFDRATGHSRNGVGGAVKQHHLRRQADPGEVGWPERIGRERLDCRYKR